MGVWDRVKHRENPREIGESHSCPFIHLCDFQSILQQILIEHPLECLMICKDYAWVGQPVKLHRPKEPDLIWLVPKNLSVEFHQLNSWALGNPLQRSWQRSFSSLFWLSDSDNNDIHTRVMDAGPSIAHFVHPLPLKTKRTFVNPGKDGSFLEIPQQS